MHHSIYDKSRHRQYVLSIKACQRSYHRERESNDRNGHQGKVFMIHDSDIILVTKPSGVDRSLDDGVAVWVTASSRFLALLRWSQCFSIKDSDDEDEQDRQNSCHLAILEHVSCYSLH